ncbi:hypothetical protein ACIA5H_36895 [Nocardia sp. NPDC051900]|uniref:hypothetical protein n=1 Tax=Nocardia sp. NPDC051900 TaxID=3364326 RepID=UPI003795E042
MRQFLPIFDPDARVRLSKVWDPMCWSSRAVLRRGRIWVIATHPGRIAVRLIISLIILLVILPLSGGAAVGRTDTIAGGRSTSAIDGVAWTDVRDSSGITLSDYLFATEGGILNPRGAALATMLDLLFAVFMVTAIWLTGFAVSFRWLD